MPRPLSLLLALLAAAPAAPAADPPPSWVGEKVFAHRPGSSTIWVDPPGGGPAIKTALMYLDCTVDEDAKGYVSIRLQVEGKPTKGKIAKADVVRLGDAPAYFSTRLKTYPKWTDGVIQRGWAYHLLDRQEEALKDFDAAVAARPASWFVWNNRGLIRTAAGDLAGAVRDFDEAVKLEPKLPAPLYNRGLVKLKQKDYSGAFKEFEAAVLLDPDYGPAYLDRSRAHEGLGEFDAALADAGTAARLMPDKSWGAARLAWLLATHPDAGKRDGAKALAEARTAYDRGHGKEAEVLAVLAAAYAEAGDFDRAVEWQAKALENPQYVKESGPAGEARLAGYRKRVPYRLVKPEKK